MINPLRNTITNSCFNIGQRAYYASQALLIGGGMRGRTVSRLWTAQLPEISDYQDFARVTLQMHYLFNVPKSNMKILFGRGENPPLMRRKWKQVHQASNFITPCKAATIENIDAAFEELKEKLSPGDRLFVVISGHGSAGNATLLANEYLSRNFITPSRLKLYIKSFTPTIPIELSVSSCYSGQFSPLRSESVSVFTTAGRGELSRYSSIHGCEHLQMLFYSPFIDISPTEYETYSKIIEDSIFSKNSCFFFLSVSEDDCHIAAWAQHTFSFFEDYRSAPLLEIHSKAATEHNNYYALDGLTYFVDQSLKEKACYTLFDRKIESTREFLNRDKTILITEIALSILLFSYPDEFLLRIVIFKKVITALKISAPAIKMVLCLATIGLRRRWQKTDFYKRKFTRYDRKLIRRIQPFLPLEVKKPSREIQNILQKLKKISEVEVGKENPLTRYHYLFEKTCFFVQTATDEELKIFVNIANNHLASYDDKAKGPMNDLLGLPDLKYSKTVF